MDELTTGSSSRAESCPLAAGLSFARHKCRGVVQKSGSRGMLRLKAPRRVHNYRSRRILSVDN